MKITKASAGAHAATLPAPPEGSTKVAGSPRVLVDVYAELHGLEVASLRAKDLDLVVLGEVTYGHNYRSYKQEWVPCYVVSWDLARTLRRGKSGPRLCEPVPEEDVVAARPDLARGVPA